MRRGQRSVGAVGAGVGLALLAAILVMANYLAARHYRRGDWTSAQVYSLSAKSIAIARALHDDVRVTVIMIPGKSEAYDAVRELLERLRRETPRLAVEYLDIHRDPTRAKDLAAKYNVSSFDLAEGVVVFEAGPAGQTKTKFVTKNELVDVDLRETREGGEDARVKAFKGEGAFASALLTVTEGTQTEVCFVKGHGESQTDSFEDEGYSQLGEELKRDNYKLTTIEALDKNGVPKPCAVVVVAGAKRAWLPPEAAALGAYLDGGGRALLLLGPEFDRGLTRWSRSGLEELALRWGARLGESVVLDLKATHPLEGPTTFGVVQYGDHPIVARLNDKLTFWPRARDVHAAPRDGLDVKELVKTSEQGFGETNLGVFRREAEAQFDAATDVKGPVPVATAASAGPPSKTTRVVVIGTPDLVMNYRLGQMRDLVADYNRDLVLNAVSWLASKEQLVAIGAKQPEHVKLTLTGEQLARLFYLAVLGLPLFAGLVGGAVWWRRRS